MGLADYRPQEREIKLNGGTFTFTVRGLALPEFTTLIQHHMPDLEAIFVLGKEALGGKTELTEGDVGKVVTAIAEQAPGLVANIIALASGDGSEKAVDAARTLMFPVQVDTLVTIINLTFDEVGGIKKAWESIAGLLTTMTKDAATMRKLKGLKIAK